MSSRSGRSSPSMASAMIARNVSSISCLTGAVESSADDIAVSIGSVTSGSRSSARDARRNTSATRSEGVVPRGGRCTSRSRNVAACWASRREQELVLRGVVPVQRAERDLGPGGDVAHLHRVVSALGSQFGGGSEESPLARGGLGGARPPCGSRGPHARRQPRSTPQSPADRSAVLEHVAATPGWRSSCCDHRSGPRRPPRHTRASR